MHYAISLVLFLSDDIGSDGLSVTLDRFGGDLEAGQQVQLLVANIEAALTSHHGHHAPHTGRALCADHIQFPIPRALPLMATRTEIVGAIQGHGPQYGQ